MATWEEIRDHFASRLPVAMSGRDWIWLGVPCGEFTLEMKLAEVEVLGVASLLVAVRLPEGLAAYDALREGSQLEIGALHLTEEGLRLRAVLALEGGRVSQVARWVEYLCRRAFELRLYARNAPREKGQFCHFVD